VGKVLLERRRLPPDAQRRFDLRLHKVIPFGSAIIIDRMDAANARIQIETKPYREGMKYSFAFEIIPTGREGLYEALLRGFERLVGEGQSAVELEWANAG
jgi:hypothetical protein